MIVVLHNRCDGPYPGWITERTIRHNGGNLYESEVREITPANPSGRIVGGMPSRFTLVYGVARWVSNGSVLMRDVVRDTGIDQLPGFSREANDAARAADLDRFMTAYRAAQPSEPSAEEMAELRANFPAGSVVVDVISGRKTVVH